MDPSPMMFYNERYKAQTKRMSFESAQLREATEKYTNHDPGTHRVYPRLVWERRSKSPIARLGDA